MNNKKILIVSISMVMVIGGLCFWGGASYATSRARMTFNPDGARLQSGAPFQTGSKNMGGLFAGNITAMDTMSLTIQGTDGNSKLVIYSTSTPVKKITQGTAKDLLVGTFVSIAGTKNNEGSITAKTIQIDPQGTSLEQNSQLAPQSNQ